MKLDICNILFNVPAMNIKFEDIPLTSLRNGLVNPLAQEHDVHQKCLVPVDAMQLAGHRIA